MAKHTASGYGRCKQGLFKPRNPKKYAGNPADIIYRSGLEERFMHYCDRHPSIIKWASEEIIIPYMSPVDNKFHRYFPDFMIQVQGPNGQKTTYLVEIKPAAQCQPPKINNNRKRKTMLNEAKTWAVNEAKWKAAAEWCADRKIKFKIFTEKDIP